MMCLKIYGLSSRVPGLLLIKKFLSGVYHLLVNYFVYAFVLSTEKLLLKGMVSVVR